MALSIAEPAPVWLLKNEEEYSCQEKLLSIFEIHAQTQTRFIVKDNLSTTAPSPTYFYPEESGTNVSFALCKQATRKDYGFF